MAAFDIAIIGQSGLQHPPNIAARAQGAEANKGTTPIERTTNKATTLEKHFIRTSHDAQKRADLNVIQITSPSATELNLLLRDPPLSNLRIHTSSVVLCDHIFDTNVST